MAKSRTYRCEDRKCAQTCVCANLRRTQSHLPWEIPALMWNQQQSHLPGYKPGLQIILLTMTVILDLKEQRGRNFKTSSPSIQVKQDYRKNRQVCNLEQKLLWPMHQEWQSQWRTELPGTAMSECPSENPITPKKKQDLCIISCQCSLHPLPARPSEKPLAISSRLKCILYSRHDKKLSWVLMQPEVLPIKGALEFSIRFTGRLWANTTDCLSAGRWTSPWVVLTFNVLVSNAPNAPALRFQSRTPLTNYSCKIPASIKELWVQIHIIKETLRSPKAKRKTNWGTKQSKVYLTSLKLYVYFCQDWKKKKSWRLHCSNPN